MKLNAPILVDSIIYSDVVSILGTIKVTWTIFAGCGTNDAVCQMSRERNDSPQINRTIPNNTPQKPTRQ